MNRLADETSPYLLQHARGVACDAAWRPCRLCRRGRFITVI
jgi:hypothetical protein